MKSITFFAPGIPRPGGSKRAFVRGGRAMVIEDCKRSKDWRAVVAMAALEAMKTSGAEPFDGPVSLEILFFLPRPKAHYLRGELRENAPGFCAKKPDATKLVRSTEDALTGIVWRDDSQVVSQCVAKRYANHTSGARISVESM